MKNLKLINNLIAIGIGLIAAVGAHASGKPWWVDYPMMSDAFDIGMTTALAVRACLWLIGD